MQNPTVAAAIWDTNEPTQGSGGQCGVVTPAYGGRDGYIPGRWLMHDGPSS